MKTFTRLLVLSLIFVAFGTEISAGWFGDMRRKASQGARNLARRSGASNWAQQQKARAQQAARAEAERHKQMLEQRARAEAQRRQQMAAQRWQQVERDPMAAARQTGQGFRQGGFRGAAGAAAAGGAGAGAMYGAQDHHDDNWKNEPDNWKNEPPAGGEEGFADEGSYPPEEFADEGGYPVEGY